MKQWVITDAVGAPIAQIYAATHPSDGKTIAWATGYQAHEVARFGDQARETFTPAKGWSVSLELVKAKLLDTLDDQREAAQMGYLTQGGAKKLVYMQKAREVIDFRSLGSAVVAALNLEGRRVRFPAAMAEVDLTGATLASVIAKFEAGAASSNANVMRLEAIAQAAKEKIKAATSEATAKTAAAVNWKTS